MFCLKITIQKEKMNLELFKNKFVLLNKFKEVLLGIETGLDVAISFK